MLPKYFLLQNPNIYELIMFCHARSALQTCKSNPFYSTKSDYPTTNRWFISKYSISLSHLNVRNTYFRCILTVHWPLYCKKRESWKERQIINNDSSCSVYWGMTTFSLEQSPSRRSIHFLKSQCCHILFIFSLINNMLELDNNKSNANWGLKNNIFISLE